MRKHGRHSVMDLKLNSKIHLLFDHPLRIVYRLFFAILVISNKKLDKGLLGFLEQAASDGIGERLTGAQLSVGNPVSAVAEWKRELLGSRVAGDPASALQSMKDAQSCSLVQSNCLSDICEAQSSPVLAQGVHDPECFAKHFDVIAWRAFSIRLQIR